MSFLDDVGHFFATDVPKFINDNKGLIQQAAPIVAGAIGGPGAAAAVKPVVDQAFGSNDKAKADAAKKLAGAHPANVHAAQAATDHVAAGAIIDKKVDDAAKGDKTAQAQLENVKAKAAAGDPSAQSTMDAAQKLAAAKVSALEGAGSGGKAALPMLAGAGALAALLVALA